MRRIPTALAAVLLGAFTLQAPVAAAPPGTPDPAPASATAKPTTDDQLSPQEQERQALRTKAMRNLTAPAASLKAAGPIKLGSDYVELAQNRKDKIFVVLAEFGDQVDTTTLYNGQVKYGGTPGPSHNAIPQPDVKADNHTLWKPNFDRAYYQDLYFNDAKGANSLRNYYQTQSSGRYDMDGYVSDWVRVPWNEARYGSDRCAEGQQCFSNFDFIRDSVTAWYTSELAKGRSAADLKADLATYDLRDPYDHDHDGNFNEPDGYIDNYEVVHAGVDQTWGGGAQGTDAIWAHRYFAYWPDRGTAGPADNKQGGTQIADTGIWVGDYLTGGENSGAGLFAHENGHLLFGLPDLYAPAGDNGVSFWSLMSSASYLSTAHGPEGEFPGDLDAWSKLQIGWLDYERANAATASTHTLGVSSYNTENAQAVLVDLPKRAVTTELTEPFQGARQWWSGRGDNLNETLTRDLDLTGVATASLDAKTWYRIEQGFDYLHTQVSTDGGKAWTDLGPALTGSSGGWVDLHVNLDAYAGQAVKLRFRYVTDTNTSENGFLLDALTVTSGGRVLLADDAENGDNGWTAVGFSRIGKSANKDYPRSYLVENRRYTGYNAYLQTGPYNFGNWGVPGKNQVVEHLPFQDGVLVWLWDSYFTDNATRDHPGAGMILPVDARPAPLRFKDGTAVGARVQPFDAVFGLKYTDKLTLHKAGVGTVMPKTAPIRAFNDHVGGYWDPAAPELSVQVPDTNTRIEIVREVNSGKETTIQVGPAS